MSTLKKPKFLTTGDTVAIIAPAGFVNRSDVEKSKELFESWGLKVVYGKNLFKQENQFAGSDLQRFSDLQAALDNDDIKAIICARGGYGTVRIIDKLDWTNFVANPKWVLGFSDITVIHSKIHLLGIESIHCPMPINLAKLNAKDPVISQLREVLFTGKLVYANLYHQLNRSGFGRAKVIGGNLSVLHSLIGTPYDIEYHDKFLFIEDVGEQLYKIDRMMHTLKLAGKFDNLEGLLVGGFTEMEDGKHPFGRTAEEIIFDIVSDYNFPVAFGLPIGHQKHNSPLILGSEIRIEISNQQAKFKFL